MSWQRILRFAKIRQVPVIVTDETGEDPMILLSLDQLEEALDAGSRPDIPPPPPTSRPSTPSFSPEEGAISEAEVTTELIDRVIEPINVMTPFDASVQVASSGVADESLETRAATNPSTEPEILTPPPAPASNMTLEERFFLEY